ncbi:hypothetical protein [Actinomadura opuntiae]|uniref:hypothetical protein n=1 Tax=Actinomadura sp. OS1-43 TaxID=604315 RepID=UPI00255AAC4F|nr:hypothetical protein [Actinomadura sp. OS1-43]MDL4818523.1 hypothetical protein [Actinomadura sp. OS1-43]
MPYDYTVHFTADALASGNHLLAEAVAEGGAARVLPVLVVLPGGGQVKDGMRYVNAVHAAIAQCRLDRHSLVPIGGGAVLDAVGFAAATRTVVAG